MGSPGTTRTPHPVVFGILCLPFGVTTGFVSVALAYLATRSGLTVQQGAVLVAANLFPQVLKFLWAPIVDISLSRRKWYAAASAVGAVSIYFCATVPLGRSHFLLLEGLILVMSLASSFVGFAIEGLLAHLTAPEDRGRVSGWYQAGNLGGSGLGGGLGLWLLIHFARWETGLGMAALVLLPLPALFLLRDVPAESPDASVGRAIGNVASDVWAAVRTRIGILSLLLCFVPIGTGTASSVLSQAEVADYWHVGAGTVAWIQGTLAGVISMAGCIVGGYGCIRIGARAAYALYGGLMALTTAIMALLPATPAVYIAGNVAYCWVTGLCYAAFSAFVLDAIGAGNAATKYNAFASLSNFPIWYMGLVLAAAETHFGPRGMLFTEAACGAAGIIVFLAIAALPFGRRAAPIPA